MEWTSMAFIGVTAVLAVLTLYFGTQVGKVKEKLIQVRELLDKVIAAAEDNKVSEAEFQGIVASVKKLLNMG